MPQKMLNPAVNDDEADDDDNDIDADVDEVQ